MVNGTSLQVALATTALISASSLALADGSGAKVLNNSQMDLVTAGAEASVTTNGAASASGPLASTISATSATASSNGTTATAGGFGAGQSGAYGGTKAADSSATGSADGLTTLVVTQSNTTNAPSWSSSYTSVGVLTTNY